MPFTPFRFVGLPLAVVVLVIACDGPPTEPSHPPKKKSFSFWR